MVIYKITNLINNKKYIGMDTHNNPNYFGSGTLIQKAIKKYGKENFTKEILEYCNSIEELESKETYWINHFNALTDKNYYNLEDNRKRGINPFANKSKAELKEIFNKINTKERAKKIGLSNKKPKPQGFGKKMSKVHTGRKRSNESKLKQSKSLAGRVSPSRKAIVYWGNGIVKTLESQSEGLKLGFCNKQISRVVNGKLKTHKKYKFILQEKLINKCQQHLKITSVPVLNVEVMPLISHL